MPPAPQAEEGFVAETTSLLKESLSNRSHMEVQLQSLSRQSSSKYENESKGCERVISSSYRRTLCMLLLGTLLTVSMLGVMIFRPRLTDSIESDDNADNEATTDADDDIADKNVVPTGDRTVTDRFPLSLLDPVRDLGLAEHGRSRDESSFPSYYYEYDKDRPRKALPTNAWYQNMLQQPQKGEPMNVQRTYAGPYLVDVVGIIPGLRVHATDIDASDMVMQLSFNERFGLVLGGTDNILSTVGGGDDDDEGSTTTHSHRYKVAKTTDLGITLEWDAMKMASNIVKGMSFVTMEYEKQKDDSSNALLPTIAARSVLQKSILVDGIETTLDCSKKMRVEKDIELYFHESDYTWMVFFSEPVWIQCSVDNEKSLLQVVDYDDEDAAGDSCSSTSDTLIMRAALIDQCTNGYNVVSCKKGLGNRLPDEPRKDDYIALLRAHVDAYPGRDTSFSYIMPDKDGDNEAMLLFDWDAKSMSDLCRQNSLAGSSPSAEDNNLLTFAIPHQMERLPSDILPNAARYCKSSLTGPTCLVEGNKWVIPQELPVINFRAKRPPKPQYIPTLAKALSSDIEYKIPDYFKRGAGDTYFSGKFLAKLARILLISDEVDSLCGEHGGSDYLQYCKNSTLPTREQTEAGIKELREGVEVWINGTAETPFVYDTSWGGVVSCGCYMEGTECTNRYPDCPGFSDPGLNFGNGFYNDHHFHYGYHIFAAAAVAHFDKVWAMDNFENVLMLVRDIANPSEEDTLFPLFRHKDWYQGSSWASGVPYPAYLNGKNQESSSEAIAAYEGVALFGQVMNKIWEKEEHERNAAVSKQIANVGKLLAGTELVSAKRYWHIQDDKGDNPVERIYPKQYSKNVIGILWQTMAQFGTWFGAKEYLPIGIQLLPITPISEDRDDIDWMNSIYKPLTYSCAIDFECTQSGWSILQLATLATVGYAAEAVMKVKELPDESFENAGGNGQSRSNTIWYLSTRPNVENPIPMVRYDKRGKEEVRPKVLYELSDCYLPDTCTKDVLDREAGEFTCRVRISWLIRDQNLPQWEACWRVAGLEFPDICGPCDPGVNFISKEQQKQEKEFFEEQKKQQSVEIVTVDGTTSSLECLPCTLEECDSDFNRCPVYKRTFVCTEGTSKGGCSGELQFWAQQNQCDSCCEMTDCFELKDKEAQKFTKDGNAFTTTECPPCTPDICYGKLNQCPIHNAPYVCTKGLSQGGCASSPWTISDPGCAECCELKVDCR